jgi:hypothetical protein
MEGFMLDALITGKLGHAARLPALRMMPFIDPAVLMLLGGQVDVA